MSQILPKCPWGHDAKDGQMGVRCSEGRCAFGFEALSYDAWEAVSIHCERLKERAEKAEALVMQLEACVSEKNRIIALSCEEYRMMNEDIARLKKTLEALT